MPLLFLLTIAVGSSLLFLVQPLCARLILPILGGTPAVWTTCMLFFQAGLLAGYAYAHLLPRRLGNRNHAMLHILLLSAAGFLLPIVIASPQQPPAWPSLWLLGTLSLAVGLPYVLVASNAPLLQRWFSLVENRDPYYLYAASNLGSFGGLLAYPLFLEPNLDLSTQADLWRWGYWPLALMTGLCALPLLIRTGAPLTSTPVPEPTEADAAAPTTGQKVRWVLLALVPSSLMLSVTTYLTSDIAPLPLFWVIPLGLYLLTFVLAFARRQLIPQEILVRSSPVAVIAVVLMLLLEANEPIRVVFGLHLAAFALLGLQCHGELARTRPAPRHLTGFYLWLSLGGVLGGLLNGLVAPHLFPGQIEYPLMLVLAMALRPRREEVTGTSAMAPWHGMTRTDFLAPILVGLATLALVILNLLVPIDPPKIRLAIVFVPALLVTYFFHERPFRFALALGALLLASMLQPSIMGDVIHRQRTFFGLHRVIDRDPLRYLFHGNTMHGCQDLRSTRRGEPLTYYSREGPAGQILRALKGDPRMQDVGLVGLGSGTLSAYAARGERWTFYEIDPGVIEIAENPAYFTYLKDARARGAEISVVSGDARLTLQAGKPQLGVLILDAFGSDSIPIHLLTREAFQEYRSYLREDGLILLNVSNRYVKLEPVLANLARELRWTCLIQPHDVSRTDQANTGKTSSVWALLAWSEAGLAHAEKYREWRRAIPSEEGTVWRDDYANFLPFIDWEMGQED